MNHNILELTELVRNCIHCKNNFYKMKTNSTENKKEFLIKEKSFILFKMESVIIEMIVQCSLNNCNIVKIKNINYIFDKMEKLFALVLKELIVGEQLTTDTDTDADTFIDVDEQLQIIVLFSDFFKIVNCK